MRGIMQRERAAIKGDGRNSQAAASRRFRFPCAGRQAADGWMKPLLMQACPAESAGSPGRSRSSTAWKVLFHHFIIIFVLFLRPVNSHTLLISCQPPLFDVGRRRSSVSYLQLLKRNPLHAFRPLLWKQPATFYPPRHRRA